MYDIAAILALSFSSFIFAYVAMNIDKKHGALQILFLSLSFLLILLNITLSEEFVRVNPDFNVTATSTLDKLDKSYTTSMWGFVIFAIYVIVMFLIGILEKFTEIRFFR